MKDLLTKLVNLVFYSNLWIALCALAMALQTELLLHGEIIVSEITLFILFSTLFLYAIHRIVGLKKVKPFQNEGRYQVIARFRNHIVVYAAIAGIAGAYYFFQLSWRVQLALVIPSILSLGYVLPLLGGKKRLRDFDHIKIFMVAIVWAWVTVILPALEWNMMSEARVWWMALERAFFIFAITLPFDIRDLKIDAHTQVKTIPAVIGVKRTKILAYLCLIFMMCWSFLNYQQGFYTFLILVALAISAISTSIFIQFSDRVEHDYFFTGLLDGTMILQFLLVYFLAC